MKIQSQVKRLTLDAVLLMIALIFSYVESLIPVLLPIPGLKLGLANIVVMYAFYYVGILDSAVISGLRVIMISILFGSVTSFGFSIFGAVLSFLMLILSKPLYNKQYVSIIGVSILCATAHNTGQILAAILLFKSINILTYLPLLLLLSIPTGILTGLIMQILGRYKLLKN